MRSLLAVRGLLSASALGVLLATSGAGVGAQSGSSNLELGATSTRVYRLPPGGVVQDAVRVESAGQVSLHFQAVSLTLSVRLTSPSGVVYESGGASTPECSIDKQTLPPEFDNESSDYIFTLHTPTPGMWSYEVRETRPGAPEHTIVFHLVSDSSVKTGLVGHSTYRSGSTMSFGFVATDGNLVLHGIAAAGSIHSTDVLTLPPIPVTFADNGTDADAVAGDGLYSALATAPPSGHYMLTVESSGQSATGEAFARSNTLAFDVIDAGAHFSDRLFAAAGIDDDGNGRFDAYGVAVHVEVVRAADYDVSVTLRAQGGRTATAHLKVPLTAGQQTLLVRFPGARMRDELRVDGPYDVALARVDETIGTETQIDDVQTDLGPTPPFSLASLEQSPIYVTGTGTAFGVDVNGVPGFEQLGVNVDATFQYPGIYSLSAKLVDRDGRNLSVAINDFEVDTAQFSIPIVFDGLTIGKDGVDSPYYVRDLFVFDDGGHAVNVTNAYTVEGFTASQFEGYMPCAIRPVEPLYVNAPGGACSTTVDYRVPDVLGPCPDVSVGCSPEPGSVFPVGQTTVTCVARNGRGLPISTSTFSVFIANGQSLYFTCPADISAHAEASACGAHVTYTAPTVGGCGVQAACTPASGSLFPVGMTQVHCNIGDPSIPAYNCYFTVRVDDPIPPSVTAPGTLTVSAPPASCTAVVNFGAPAASDNCAVTSLVCTPASGSSFALGTTTVTCVAADAAGNTSSCSFPVVVRDATAPTMTCPASSSTNAPSGVCLVTVNYAVPSASDACSSGQGRGTDSAGLYDATTGTFALRNLTASGPADLSFVYGTPNAGWLPIAGDWDNDGDDTIGLYDRSTARFHLRNSNSAGGDDVTFLYGAVNPTVIPVAGDWDGDGRDTIGLYVPSTGTFLLRNSNSAGGADLSFTFGAGGTGIDPVVGDWDGNGTDTIGLFVESTRTFLLRNSNTSGPAEITTTIGAANAQPVVGDWNADRTSTVGVRDPGTSTFSLKDANDGGAANRVFTFGTTESVPATPRYRPVVGNWNWDADHVTGVTVACSPATGTSFPIGVTTVTCGTQDAAGNSASCSFGVTVRDLTAPTITCPTNITAVANQLSGSTVGRTVTYAPVASDCTATTVTCTPASGTFFAVGTRTVTCTARDTSGNVSAACSFVVTITTPFTVCIQGNGRTGFDTFREVGADPTSPLYGYWEYRTAGGTTFSGYAEYVYQASGVFKSYDHDSTVYKMDLNVSGASSPPNAVVTVIEFVPNPDVVHTFTDSDLRDDTGCS